jgi:hypothetical protein
MTERKREMIEGSRSEAQLEATALAEAIKDLTYPVALMMKDIVGWVRQASQGRVFDSDYELRKAMTENGVRSWPRRVKANGRLQIAIMNDVLWDQVTRSEGNDKMDMIRSHVHKPIDLMENEM